MIRLEDDNPCVLLRQTSDDGNAVLTLLESKIDTDAALFTVTEPLPDNGSTTTVTAYKIKDLEDLLLSKNQNMFHFFEIGEK